MYLIYMTTRIHTSCVLLLGGFISEPLLVLIKIQVFGLMPLAGVMKFDDVGPFHQALIKLIVTDISYMEINRITKFCLYVYMCICSVCKVGAVGKND